MAKTRIKPDSENDIEFLRAERDKYRSWYDGACGDIDDLEGRIEKLERELDDNGHIEELIAIRDDLRASRHAIALDRLTRWLDRNVDCWRTLQPAHNPNQSSLLPGGGL